MPGGRDPARLREGAEILAEALVVPGENVIDQYVARVLQPW